MERDIRIKIKSARYEVDSSLFSEDPEDGVYAEYSDGDAPEVIEICTVGKLKETADSIEISYEETEATGMEGSVSSVSFLKSDRGIVSMARSGIVSAVLTFEAGKRYRCVYKTPYMPFEVCVHTLKVENSISALGFLNLDYIVEIRGAKAERTKFSMQIL